MWLIPLTRQEKQCDGRICRRGHWGSRWRTEPETLFVSFWFEHRFNSILLKCALSYLLLLLHRYRRLLYKCNDSGWDLVTWRTWETWRPKLVSVVRVAKVQCSCLPVLVNRGLCFYGAYFLFYLHKDLCINRENLHYMNAGMQRHSNILNDSVLILPLQYG